MMDSFLLPALSLKHMRNMNLSSCGGKNGVNEYVNKNNPVCIYMRLKLHPCTHERVWQSQQEIARMCKIPNFPHGLFPCRKRQLSSSLSIPLIVACSGGGGTCTFVGMGGKKLEVLKVRSRPHHPYAHTCYIVTQFESFVSLATMKCGSIWGPFSHSHDFVKSGEYLKLWHQDERKRK